MGGVAGIGGGGAHARRRGELVLPGAAPRLQQGGCMANDLLSRACGRSRRDRGMVQGRRPSAVSRAARSAVARGISRALHGRGGARVSHLGGRLGVVTVPEIVHGGGSLGMDFASVPEVLREPLDRWRERAAGQPAFLEGYAALGGDLRAELPRAAAGSEFIASVLIQDP